jgi:hypothetical protein
MKTFKAPLTLDGRPDFRGNWSRTIGPPGTIEEVNQTWQRGAPQGSRRASLVVDPPDARIPYQSWAREQAGKNFQIYLDPQNICVPPGPQRFPYTAPAGGYLILQPPGDQQVVILHERVHTYRVIPMNARPHIPANLKLYEGDSVGRWEGNTLVVDITNVNGETWFDHAGNFLTDAAHLVERWTLVDRDTIHVETTIEDPRVLTRPMKIAVSLVRIKDPGHELIEDACWEGESDKLLKAESNPYPGRRPYPGWKDIRAVADH